MECFTLWYLLYAWMRATIADAVTGEVPAFWQLSSLLLILLGRLTLYPLSSLRWLVLLCVVLPLYLLCKARYWGGADLKFAVCLMLLRGVGFMSLSLLVASLFLLLQFLVLHIKIRLNHTHPTNRLPLLPAWSGACVLCALFSPAPALLLL